MTILMLQLAATLTLIMNLHLHLLADHLMLSMWPLGHHQHHGDLLDRCLDCITAMRRNKARSTTSLHRHVLRHDLEDILISWEDCPDIYQGGGGGTPGDGGEDGALYLSSAGGSSIVPDDDDDDEHCQYCGCVGYHYDFFSHAVKKTVLSKVAVTMFTSVCAEPDCADMLATDVLIHGDGWDCIVNTANVNRME